MTIKHIPSNIYFLYQFCKEILTAICVHGFRKQFKLLPAEGAKGDEEVFVFIHYVIWIISATRLMREGGKKEGWQGRKNGRHERKYGKLEKCGRKEGLKESREKGRNFKTSKEMKCGKAGKVRMKLILFSKSFIFLSSLANHDTFAPVATTALRAHFNKFGSTVFSTVVPALAD